MALERLLFDIREIDNDITERQYAGWFVKPRGRDLRTLPGFGLELVSSILREGQDIRGAVNSPVMAVEESHPPVADKEDADLSSWETEQAEQFPENPCRFLRAYLYASLLILY